VSSPKPSEAIVYQERVRPNFGTFLATAALIPAITLVSEPFDFRIGLIIGSVLVLAIWWAMFFLSPVIRVREKSLSVGVVSIPRSLLGRVEVIAKDQIFQERGPKLEPAAFKVFQGTVKTAVKIEISDPSDPTPYWIISTRKPIQLASALESKP
jgi:hypothetical protein